jgi:hypothetical protein
LLIFDQQLRNQPMQARVLNLEFGKTLIAIDGRPGMS